MLRRWAVLVAWLGLPAIAPAAVFQYTATVETTKGPAPAFLWVPPEARQIRGVLVAGMTLAEADLVRDAVVRRACVDRQLAIVFLKAGLATVEIPRLLAALADASSYRELTVAPLFLVGHSAGGPQAKAAAIAHAERCFGVMQYRGGVPGGAEAVPPGVPALMMIGQFDEFGGAMRGDKGREAWETGRDALADFRSKDPANLGSVVVEWGAGHFAWSTRNADYFARYLRKAADARIPDWPADAKEVVRCKVVDPASGWLSDLDLKTPGKVASHGEYTGERSRAAWHFDRELAEATTAFHAGWGKEDQFIEWADPTWVDAGVRHFFTDVRWVEDGQTFRLRPRYARTYPKTQPDGKWPRWGSAAGKEVGHSDAEIRVRVAAGPLEPVAADCLRIRFDALFPATEPVRATFLAVSAGDAKYRPTEQVGMLPRGFSGLKAGKDQSITFPQPADLKLGGEVELRATSDAGLPVSYHVAEGPAVVEGGKLRAAQVPARARLPLTVRVVAYQFGRGVEPLVKTASPVERTVRLVKQ